VIESALSIIVAALLGYWHALYAWVIGLSVLTAAFFLVTHKVSPRIARQDSDATDSVSLIWTNFVKTAIFISVNVCFLAVHFTRIFCGGLAALRFMEDIQTALKVPVLVTR
jgi:hypothetical protein